MLAHPKTIPHLNTILGEGWRLDHGPGLIAMDKGCSGGMLHGNFDNAPYFYREGRIFTGSASSSTCSPTKAPATAASASFPAATRPTSPALQGCGGGSSTGNT